MPLLSLVRGPGTRAASTHQQMAWQETVGWGEVVGHFSAIPKVCLCNSYAFRQMRATVFSECFQLHAAVVGPSTGLQSLLLPYCRRRFAAQHQLVEMITAFPIPSRM